MLCNVLKQCFSIAGLHGDQNVLDVSFTETSDLTHQPRVEYMYCRYTVNIGSGLKNMFFSKLNRS